MDKNTKNKLNLGSEHGFKIVIPSIIVFILAFLLSFWICGLITVNYERVTNLDAAAADADTDTTKKGHLS